MDNYRRTSHAKYSLKIHLIFVTKYRKKLFKDKNLNRDVKQFLYDICNEKGFRILQMETDKDHIHILLEYKSKYSVSEIAKILKQYSTDKMWKAHELTLAKHYWKRRILWPEGYFACSIGQVSQSTIEEYIKNQG